MQETKEIRQGYYKGERPLFQARGIKIYDTVFDEGESPLKESSDIEVVGCMFKWKYPFWYSKHIIVEDCTLFDMARAGIWYTDDISVSHTMIESPKNFRRCSNVTLKEVHFANAEETLWQCQDVTMSKVFAKGDYFAMNCNNMQIDGLELIGNYSFDGVKNVELSNCRLISKDAFWNSENVTVYDSFISGEYLGWNAKNLTLINCTVESLQGLCYIDNLIMKGCKLIHTTQAFEYSSINAEVIGRIDSIMNPAQGRIVADSIGEIILERDKIDPEKTEIICRNKNSDKPECA